MRIAFWSEQKEAGTTYNLAAVACTAVMHYPISAAVLSGGYEDDGLQRQLCQGEKGSQERQQYLGEEEGHSFRRKMTAAEEGRYFFPMGMDFLLQKAGSRELTEEVVRQNMKEIVSQRLYCLPCGKKQYQEWWDKEELFRKMEQIEQCLEEQFDVVFIDCGCRKDDFSRKMLEQADVCVLNMNQEKELIGHYYKSRMKLLGKVFFLVGNYFKESVHNRANLEKIYRIDENMIGAVPYNVHLQAAGLQGRTQGYVKSQLQQVCELEFQRELTRSTRLIMQLAGIEL